MGAIVIVGLIALFMGWVFGSMGSKAKVKAAKLEADRAIDAYQRKVDTEFVPLYQEAKAKAERYFIKVEGACQERDAERVRCHKAMFAAGNAQSMMMVTIEKLARELKAKGGYPKIPNVIKTVMDEYQAEYIEPLKEEQAKELASKDATP